MKPFQCPRCGGVYSSLDNHECEYPKDFDLSDEINKCRKELERIIEDHSNPKWKVDKEKKKFLEDNPDHRL